jgi:hypothetical protein
LFMTLARLTANLPRPSAGQEAKKRATAFRRQLRAFYSAALLHPKAKSSRQRVLGPEQKHLFTCFRQTGLPPNNNQAVFSLRHVVVMRKLIRCNPPCALTTTDYCSVR